MKRYTQTLKVRSYELDAQGHVNYAVYLNYCEYARVAIMERLGIPFQGYFNHGIYIVVAEAKLKYVSPAFLGDELEITLEGIKEGRTSLVFRQDIFNVQSGKKIFEAEMVAVFIDAKGKPIPMDPKFRDVFFE